MIRLPKIDLDEEGLRLLRTWQEEVDRESDFKKKSKKAKSLFSKKNTKKNPTFIKVKKALTEMCSGARRCVYCEDSVADEVEHIFPKDLFPEKTFVWENYAYACGPCNGPKNNRFAIFRSDDGKFQKVNPPDYPKDTRPPEGKAVLLNPRLEEDNPLDYAILDLKGTFLFQPLPGISKKKKQRFHYTYEEVLRLNEREYLVEARQEAYEDYKARVVSYDLKKKNGGTKAQLDKLILRLKKKAHPTVWQEIKRYRRKRWLKQIDPALDLLFDENPEALDW